MVTVCLKYKWAYDDNDGGNDDGYKQTNAQDLALNIINIH